MVGDVAVWGGSPDLSELEIHFEGWVDAFSV